MDTQLITEFGQVAGIGGLALGVFLFVAKDLIRKAIFPTLTKQQSSRIILVLAFMAWTTALAGIASWTYIKIIGPTPPNDVVQKTFPINDSDKKTVSETLAFIEIKLTLLNEIYTSFSRSMKSAHEYTKDANTAKYKTLVSYLQFNQKEMINLLKQNHPLANALHEELKDTPISAANLSVLYDIVNSDGRELSERLTFVLVLLDSDMPFDDLTREKWIATTLETHRLGILILSSAICEFLLPIDRDALRDFRIEFLPTLTEFESNSFNFSLDETQLRQRQSAAARKRDSLGDELYKMLGGLNIKSQVLKSRVHELRIELRDIVEDHEAR